MYGRHNRDNVISCTRLSENTTGSILALIDNNKRHHFHTRSVNEFAIMSIKGRIGPLKSLKILLRTVRVYGMHAIDIET